MTMLLDSPSRTAQPLTTDTHGEPPKLTHEELARTHAETLAAPKRKYSLASRFLFLQMDLLYGRRRTLEKFMVLEIVARVPYQTWESASYKQITRKHRKVGLALRIFDRLRAFRAQQDNEQWHLLILSELVDRSGKKTGFLRFRLLPQLMAFGWWNVCWLMYAVKPNWSHRLNADFEDHAEHQYAELVEENPDFDTTPYVSTLCAEYGTFDSLADLFRQIGHDERCHKRESEQHLQAPRVR
ncbi:MAG TPA: alternative oxidase [Actinomycetes bacterium]